jgi:hypothetical protein
MLLVDMLFIFSELGNRAHESMSFSVLRIGSSALQHWLRDIYSASVELNAISVCSLINQCVGTPAKTIIKPVRDKHESRRCANYWCHIPTKSLAQYESRCNIFVWFHESGLSLVHYKK